MDSDKLRKLKSLLKSESLLNTIKIFLKINEKIQFLQNELNTKTELGKVLYNKLI